MNDIKDVKPPIYLPDFWWLLWLLLIIIALAVGIYFLLHYKKPLAVRVEPPAPKIPAWDQAYQELEALRRENLLDKGLFKEFFTRVSDIARRYMENRFNIHAPHMTTEEFMYYVGKSGHLNDTQNLALKEFLNSCDMVKFAKYDPSVNEALKNFDLCKKLVDDTRSS